MIQNKSLRKENPFILAAKQTKLGCIPMQELNWKLLTEYSGTDIAPNLKRNAQQILSNQNVSSGSPTRGWHLEAPQRGHERHELAQVCPECFLNRETEGFPICPKLEIGNQTKNQTQCLPMRQGIQSAYNRARQWKYEKQAEEAKEMLRLGDKCKNISREDLREYLDQLTRIKSSLK